MADGTSMMEQENGAGDGFKDGSKASALTNVNEEATPVKPEAVTETDTQTENGDRKKQLSPQKDVQISESGKVTPEKPPQTSPMADVKVAPEIRPPSAESNNTAAETDAKSDINNVTPIVEKDVSVLSKSVEDISQKTEAESAENEANSESSSAETEAKPAEAETKPADTEAKLTESVAKSAEAEVEPAESEANSVEPAVESAETEAKSDEAEAKSVETDKSGETEDKPMETEDTQAEIEVKPADPKAKPTETEAKEGEADDAEATVAEGENTAADDTEAATTPTKKRGRPKGVIKSATKVSPRRAKAKDSVIDAKEEEKEKEGAEPMITEPPVPSTPQLGLLERPVEIQTGKRNRRKVDRLAENMSSTPAATSEKKKVAMSEGSGVKLGDCPAIEEAISKTKAEELKTFHRFLYGVIGKSPMEIKKNLRSFCGFSFTVEDADYKKKLATLSKINMPVLKSWAVMLKLAVGGGKDVLVDRILVFLMKPTAEGKQSQTKKSDAGKRKRGSGKVEEVEDEGDDSAASDDEDDEPVAKRRKSGAGAEPATRRNTRKTRTPPAKSKAAEKSPRGKGRGRGKKAAAEEDSADEGSPTDKVLTSQIQKILKTADLEKVTMKTVRQQVLNMYPDFDLTDKRDFIKSTVKEILGA